MSEMRWELAPSGGVPGSYGFDAVARVKMRDGRPDRRFLMWRVRRYDPKLLSDSLAEFGWKTIERIDYSPDGKKTPGADALTETVRTVLRGSARTVGSKLRTFDFGTSRRFGSHCPVSR